MNSALYVEFKTQNNKEDPKFEVGDHVRISKYKNIFVKGYVANWSEDVFKIKNVKYIVLWTYVISGLNGEEIVGTFYQRRIGKNKSKRD